MLENTIRQQKNSKKMIIDNKLMKKLNLNKQKTILIIQIKNLVKKHNF